MHSSAGCAKDTVELIMRRVAVNLKCLRLRTASFTDLVLDPAIVGTWNHSRTSASVSVTLDFNYRR